MVTIFRSVLLLTLFVYCLAGYGQKPQVEFRRVSQIKSFVAQLSQANLKRELKLFLQASNPGRMVGTLGHKRAAEYIIKKINQSMSNDSKLYYQNFMPDLKAVKAFYQQDFEQQIKHNLAPYTATYKRWKIFTNSVLASLDQLKEVKGKNIIWEKQGKKYPHKFYIIGAHYDTIAFDAKTMKVRLDNQTPGADDNGTGVVIALELVKLLSKIDLDYGVKIVFFDFQELGFNGSKAFVARYFNPPQQWLGYINVEMLGHDSTILDKSKKSGNMKLYIRDKSCSDYKAEASFAQQFVKLGKVATSTVRFKIMENSFNMSDHINFWPIHVPTIALTQDWENDLNPRHHTANDFFETLNFSTYYAAYRFIAAAVVQLCHPIKKR